MNRKLTWGNARDTIARAIGSCATDPATLEIGNESHERCMNMPQKWVGKVIRYRSCTNQKCITWPRHIAAIESYSICGVPGKIRNGWFEFLGTGPGYQDSESCFDDMLPGDDACTFDDILGTSSKVRVHSDVPEAAGAKILIQGYDDSSQWVMTEYPAASGTWIDGEWVGISTAYAYSTKKFSSITDVIKPITNGPVRLYEYDTVTAAVLRALAFYESDETHPVYRRSRLPSLGSGSCNCNGEANDVACDARTLLIRATLTHIPVRNENDHLILRNLPALKLMAMAIRKEEQEMFNAAEAYELKAIRELERELATYQGSGETVPINWAPRGEPIESLI